MTRTAGPTVRSRARVASLAALLVAAQAVVLFGLPAGETGLRFPPRQAAPSIELYGDRALLQTFIARADGLSAITLYPSPRRRPTTGTVTLALEMGPQTPVAHATVTAAAFLAGPAWTWSFPPIEKSAGQLFWLRIANPDAPEGNGLSVVIGPPVFADGALYVGGRAQWGDLQFRTRSEHARVVDLLRRRPAGQRGVWVPVVACAGIVAIAISLSALVAGLMRDREAA